MELMSILLIAIATALTYYFCFRKDEDDRFDEFEIPYIKPLPIFGNMGRVLCRMSAFIEYMRDCYFQFPQAKYFGFYDFSKPTIIIRDPELVKSILIKNFDHFIDHRGFVDASLDPLFGTNLFSLRGDTWREMRNLLTPAFTSSKMKGMFKLMENCSENYSNFLVMKIKKERQNILTINSKEIFGRYTNDVIATCAFGIEVDSLKNPNNDFYRLGSKATNFEGILSVKFMLLRNFPILSQLFGVKLLGQDIEDFFYKLVAETVALREEKSITRPDMLQLMIDLKKNPNNHRLNLTIQDMTAQAFVFFFGGFDSSSSFMSFVAHIIAVHPEVQKRLHDEIDEIHEKFNGEPSYEAINNLQYLEAVLHETSRLYPLGGILDRVCTKNFELPPVLPGRKPFMLKPKDCIIIPVYGFHSDPQYYDNPDKFIPERFLNDPKGIINSPTYMPFGNGPRMCIGNRFALLETKVLLYYLLLKFNLKASKKMILPLKMSTSSFALLPKGGFWLDLQLRNE